MERDRLYEMDALRLIAALCVVLFHYTFSGWAKGETAVVFAAESVVSKYGYLGVDLFFLISGFVVLMSAWGRSPRDFAVSRFVRLYPAYWVGVVVTAVVVATLGAGVFEVTPVQFLANLSMFQSVADIPNVDVVYWTLWTEMRFYAVIFALTLVGMTKNRMMAVLWGWLALTFAVQAGLAPRVLDLLVQSEFSHYFIAGMAMFMLYRFGMSLQIALIIPICLGNAVFRAVGFAEAVGRRYQVGYSDAVIVAVVVLIFVVMLLVATRVTKPLGRPGMVTAGALTYPLYLLHAHIGFILFNLFDAHVNAYVLLAGITTLMLVAAYGMHRFVEKPLASRLKRALSRPRAREENLQIVLTTPRGANMGLAKPRIDTF
ncbi:acyltransferase family protein [Nonomuraea sp. NPDC050663]|uniref:acyltransferase family protein n=1 Tax=Nonomuraea sp. NPDC050663 TaxID=3364370 RepID=UPI003792FB65